MRNAAEIRDLKRELDRVTRERDILAKAVAFFSASTTRKGDGRVSFIAEEKAASECSWSVSEMCQTLDVSRSGFYGWARRGPCARDVDDATLAAEIEAIWETSGRTYGSPRVHRWLRTQGFRVARKRVARIMRTKGWVGESARKGFKTTPPNKRAVPAPDRVARDFNPAAPNVTWGVTSPTCAPGTAGCSAPR